MWYPYSQSSSVSPWPFFEPAPLSCDLREKHPIWLTVETAVVTTVTIAAIRFLNARHTPDFRWFVIPGLLVSAALIPTWLRKGQFPPIGLGRKQIPLAIGAVCHTCVYVLPAMLLGLWLMTFMHLPIPLKPVFSSQHNWLTWLIYQFTYVAVAEEVFFRGYVQTNVARAISKARWESPQVTKAISILVSAGGFALAHFAIQGRSTALLTFVPGLLMAWLFVRTRSLLAPILFHGLANVSYGIMVSI